MWIPRWKSVSEVEQLPPEPMSTAVAVQTPLRDGREPKRARAAGGKSSLWRSASIGLLFSAFIIILQVGNGQGFELANYAHAASLATIIALLIRILTAPLIFVLVAIVRNLLSGRQKSSASALLGALTFAMLLALILGGLVVYGEVFFSSDEAISGESRKASVADSLRLCVQEQRSLPQDATESEINQYCRCVGEKIADGRTYRQLGLHASAPANRKKAEAAGIACAIAGN
jgi:hypothetical protein